MRRAFIAAGFMVTVSAGVPSAQTPAKTAPPPVAARSQPAAAPKPAVPPAPTVVAPPPRDTYVYEPANRRDPFVSVLGSGVDQTATSRKGGGIAGTATADLGVRGIMQNGNAYTALVTGADTKTYVVHAGDKLLDGTIKNITADGLTVVQEVNDPLSLVKTREVRKMLRSKEDAKP